MSDLRDMGLTLVGPNKKLLRVINKLFHPEPVSTSTPAGSAPSGSAPSGSAPSDTTPSGSALSGSKPPGSTPAEALTEGIVQQQLNPTNSDRASPTPPPSRPPVPDSDDLEENFPQLNGAHSPSTSAGSAAGDGVDAEEVGDTEEGAGVADCVVPPRQGADPSWHSYVPVSVFLFFSINCFIVFASLFWHFYLFLFFFLP